MRNCATIKSIGIYFNLPAFVYLMAGLLLTCLCGCSTKKNTATSRQWQAFTTRYNVYYNGIEHFNEQLKDMESNYEDDYTRQVITHPAVARADSKLPQPTGDFNRTIEKMQKAIQLHSIKKKPAKRTSNQKEKAFRAREEFNPFLHNAWLTMAKSQYYNGDFLGAAATFMYISKHFTWLPEVVTEARLWEARSYCAMGWNYETENVLHLVKEKDITSSQLKLLYNIVTADYLIHVGQLKESTSYLEEAAKSSSGSQKNRLWFLLGQLYTYLGERKAAYEAFGKAASGPSTPYRTKFNARVKQSEVFSGTDIRREVNSLKSLTRFERNREYFDQIYYAIGNLYLSRKDTVHAIENYQLAVKNSTRNGIDMALARLALGNIYFNQAKYAEAQPCYSEAIPQLPDNYPDYKMLARRSDVLDELAVYAQNVALQDSLLKLSALSPEQQLEAAQRQVDKLMKEEKEAEEAAEREKAMAQRAMNRNLPGMPSSPVSPGFQMNADKSWYFYNNITKNAGKTEFQRKWGSRRLEDDWRRRNKNTFTFDDADETDDELNYGSEMSANRVDSVSDEKKEMANKENDPHFVEYYLKQIPKTREEIDVANDVIQEGLYNMGIILKDKLEDYKAARHEFNELDKRYPENAYRLSVYYNMYLMAVRENNKEEAERWRSKILTDFPDSSYGTAMRDPEYFNNLRRMHEVQESMYDAAYTAYLDNDNQAVHDMTAKMEADYPLSPILPKFVFINALSYLTEGDNQQFKDQLTELLQRWPDTDMTDMASSILKGLKAGRVPHAGISNSRGMIWDIKLGDETAEEKGEDGLPANFERDPEAPQYLVLAFPLDSVNPNLVLYDVARFNFSSFLVKDFDLEPMSFSNIGLLVIKGFANLKELENYRTVMENSNLEFPAEVTPIMISKANFELLLREGRSFEEYFRFKEESDIEEVEKSLDEINIDDDEIESVNPGIEEDDSQDPESSEPEEETENQ